MCTLLDIAGCAQAPTQEAVQYGTPMIANKQVCRSQGCAGAICDNFHHTEIKVMEVSCANNDEDRVENCAVPVAYLDVHLELVR